MPEPTSDERLSELEEWAENFAGSWHRVRARELMAEVRRLREEVAQLRAPEYAVQVAHDLARASTMTVHEAQQALGVVQDAIDARARVAELEQTVQRVRAALDGLHDEECAARSDTPCDCAVAEVKRALDGGGHA